MTDEEREKLAEIFFNAQLMLSPELTIVKLEKKKETCGTCKHWDSFPGLCCNRDISETDKYVPAHSSCHFWEQLKVNEK